MMEVFTVLIDGNDVWALSYNPIKLLPADLKGIARFGTATKNGRQYINIVADTDFTFNRRRFDRSLKAVNDFKTLSNFINKL